MAEYIHVQLKAEGQGLAVQAPPVVATDSVARLAFDVEFSEEWDGFDAYHVAQRRGNVVRKSRVEDGTALAADDLISEPGALEVALFATRAGERMTSERAIINLEDSNL